MALNDASLGRSIQDVLAKTVRREPSRGYLEVDLAAITPSPRNPRAHYAEDALAELAESIAAHGILQPIVVVRREIGYEIVSGERRYRAAAMAGLSKVPVVIREEDDPQHLAELRLVENLQRSDLNPIELSEGLQVLIDEHGLTHDEVAGRVNKDRSTISNLLRLTALPAPIKAYLVAGTLGIGHAKALLAIADAAWQQRVATMAAEQQWSVREVERLARLGPSALTAPSPAAKPAHIKELEANLKLLFGTTVTVREKASGAGDITLRFHGKEQFNRVVAIMDRFVKQANLRSPGE